MKKTTYRKLGNLGNVGNLGYIIQSFLISEFSILPTAKIENSELEISKKNLRDFRDFRVSQVFDLSKLLYFVSS